MFERGLAYKKNAVVNWDPVDQTVLANEQVIDGKGWRSGATIEQKEISQWFFKITAYAEELLQDIDTLEGWPEQVRIMQRNWIGKSEGSIIKFPIEGEERTIDIFTTRADTLFGVTFMVFAPEHPWIREWVESTDYFKEFEQFYREVVKQNKFERTDIDIEKKGMFIGKYAINPINKEKVPIYIGNFVIYEITRSNLELNAVSNTFHGRDIFTPVASHILNGLIFDQIGPIIYDFVDLDFGRFEITDKTAIGKIIYIDSFGNIITNIDGFRLRHVIDHDKKIFLSIGKKQMEIPFVKTYNFVKKGELLTTISSSNKFEIALNQGDAGKKLGVKPDDEVKIVFN